MIKNKWYSKLSTQTNEVHNQTPFVALPLYITTTINM